MATRPVVVFHTGVKGTADNNRNLSDEQIRQIAQTGGVVGIGFWSAATGGEDAQAIARAIHYAADIVGVVARAIIGLRVRYGLSQSDFAAKVSRPQSYIPRLESGKSNVEVGNRVLEAKDDRKEPRPF